MHNLTFACSHGLLLQVLSERPLAFWQIVIAIGAIELSVGKQDYENKVRTQSTRCCSSCGYKCDATAACSANAAITPVFTTAVMTLQLCLLAVC
jgi:hypothetical protein